MQGRQNVSNLERKGPHKSMHCKFCKPPGVVTPEKPTRAQMETKTRIHLAHEAADLRLCDVYDEPGSPAPPETDACICVLEGENPCPKCVPDKNREPVKKKTCRCPKGAKPHPNMLDGAAPKKKKEKVEDDEFWWEKYSREHDAVAQETWAAYMAQRRKEKKLQKCQKREQEILLRKNSKGMPTWYQKLSCQQMMYIEFLSTAIRLDSDENITDRTYFVLSGIGLYPRPKRKVLKKCLRFCHYNSIQFLNQLHLLTRDYDPFHEKLLRPSTKDSVPAYTWNERLIMSSMCHLEFPALLREVMDRLPPFPRDQILPQIPYPVFPKVPKKKNENPYEEPIWRERFNWVDKMKLDRLNRCRLYMDTKRVKIPPLALVRRASLIDARPPFLNQIEANERASRRPLKQKEKRAGRKHPISTFNSAVDVTAIAGIEASEISTTDKADTEEICVFLRDPLREPESTEEEEFVPEKEIAFALEYAEEVATQVDRLKERFSDFGECSADEDVPFKTPPKTESGATIKSVCVPPGATPGPPAVHYDVAKRELDIINEDLCGFHPFASSSKQTVRHGLFEGRNDVEMQLMSAAERLKEFADEAEERKDFQKPKEKKLKRNKCGRKRKRIMKRTRLSKKGRNAEKPGTQAKAPAKGEAENSKEEEKDEGGEGDEEEDDAGNREEKKEDEGSLEDAMGLGYQKGTQKEKTGALSRKESEISEPDPDSDEVWSTRPPCTPRSDKVEEEEVEEERKKNKKKHRKRRVKRRKDKRENKRAGRNKEKQKEKEGMKLREEKDEYFKKKVSAAKVDRGTMTECYPGEYDHLYAEALEERKETPEPEEVSPFRGEIEPLLIDILKDLADEGYVSASYVNIHKHPDVDQLILYLKGEIVDKETREFFHSLTKARWAKLNKLNKFRIPELGISSNVVLKATWNDKGWISRLAKAKTNEFYFKVANTRTEFGKELYNTLYQSYFGTDRYLKIYYAYMTSKFEDAILRGIW